MSQYQHINFHNHSAVTGFCDAIVSSSSSLYSGLSQNETAEISLTRASVPLTGMPLGRSTHFRDTHIGIVGTTREYDETLSQRFTKVEYFSPEDVVVAINAAIAACCTAAAIAVGNVPKLTLTATGLSLNTPAAFTSGGWKVAGNVQGYNLLVGGWVTTANTRPGDVLTHVLPSTSSGLQMFSTLASFYKNKEVVIATTTLPIVGEVAVGSSHGIRVLSDYDISSVNPRQNVIIMPAVDRWCSLQRSGPIETMDLRVFYRDVEGQLYPLTKLGGETFSAKICIRRQ